MIAAGAHFRHTRQQAVFRRATSTRIRWTSSSATSMSPTRSLDLAFPAGSSLAVVNPRGDVTISGTSDDNRIHVAVHKQVYARSDSDADSKAQQLTPATANNGSGVTLTMPSLRRRARRPGDPGACGGRRPRLPRITATSHCLHQGAGVRHRKPRRH